MSDTRTSKAVNAMYQKRPINYQKRPINYQKRPINVWAHLNVLMYIHECTWAHSLKKSFLVCMYVYTHMCLNIYPTCIFIYTTFIFIYAPQVYFYIYIHRSRSWYIHKRTCAHTLKKTYTHMHIWIYSACIFIHTTLIFIYTPQVYINIHVYI